ncbi:MAG: hypothetical protein KBS81_05380, partial [Spirochaetales bacterium]|nr:hypothetical protein [Candidatus Physcosoma equi]
DMRILEVLMDKEIEVHKTLGDTGSVTEILSPEKEEKAIVTAIAKDETDLDLIDIFATEASTQKEPIICKTAAVESDAMVEQTTSLFGSDTAFYAQMLDLLKSKHYISPDDYSVELNNDYIKIRNNEMLDRVLFDMPEEAKPKLNDEYKLTTNKQAVMTAISKSRKKDNGKGRQWAEFQIMYDLHPVIHYYQTCLDSCLNKDQAIAAKLSMLPKGTAWFAFQGSVSNGLGQQIVSEFFVIPLNQDGSLAGKPISMKDFSAKYLNATLPTSPMTDDDMAQLKVLLSEAVDEAVNNYMAIAQANKEMDMKVRKDKNLAKLEEWKLEAENGQISLFNDTTVVYSKSRYDKEIREIETIHSESSKYINDMNTLKGEPFVRPLVAFYNF